MQPDTRAAWKGLPLAMRKGVSEDSLCATASAGGWDGHPGALHPPVTDGGGRGRGELCQPAGATPA